MVNERVRLQWLLSRLRATLTDADGHHAKSEALAAWLRKLRVLACDIEDLLDEFEYQDLRFTAVEADEGGGGGEISREDTVFSLPPHDDQQVVAADRVVDIRRRINEVMEDKQALDMLGEFDDDEETDVESAEGWDQVIDTAASSVLEPEMIGRDREKDETVGFLLGIPTDDDLSVLAVVGIGGVGKTTLALSAYNDGKVEDHFDLRIWVHVSYSFDVWRITKQLVQHVTDPELLLHEIDNFDVLQITLANKLRDRCFLLVLDDMWFEDSVLKNNTAWETLCAPLLCGGKGSKILVTTRSTQVVGVMQPVKTMRLEGLGPEDSWSLFKKHAFCDGDAPGKSTTPNIEDIGKEIVEKLEGVPLAIRAIGGLLRSTTNERDWRNVLESKLWELDHGEGGILPALRISYEHLQPHLKPCFAHCSVYSKGREFDKLELVQQWMALGYIEPRRGRQMEEVGNDYVNSLVSRSLIQILEGKYTVHDLLHDLGRSILQGDFCEVTSDQVQQITVEDQQKYHLSILHKKVDGRDLAKLQKFWRLRSCIFVFSHRFTLQIPPILFPNMTCLRVLDLSGGGIHALSDSIDNLKHLRYLDLRRTSLRHLPESLCSLFMLQTLRLQGCEELEKLPKDMCSLINLRHLQAKHELISGIFGIGRLVQLQEIEVFSISEGSGIRIEDLKDMNELRGKLCIRNLQRVGSKEEASLANLSRKKYVKRLELEWDGSDLDHEHGKNSELEEAVLDALVPPPRLMELTIRYYAGEDFPCWMEHQFISGLESVSLYRCQRWEQLPPLVGMLPFLKKLEISYFPRLIELPSLPTTLTHLRLEGMGLSAVPVLEELPLLQELIMCNMPGLRELPPLPVALSVFKLEKLAALRDLPAFHGFNGRPQLCELKIAGCQNLRSLGGLLREQLPCLSKLSIESCEELVSWPNDSGFRATLLSLQELSIRGCPKLTALPQGSVLSPDMKKLTVEGCPSFPDSSFFAQMQDMKNLNRQGDVFVEKQYQDLRRCSEEALKHMRSINWLIIQFMHQDHGGGSPRLISLEYDIQKVVRRASIDLASYRRIVLKIMGNGNEEEEEEEEEERRSTLPTCLGHRHLCSSLFSLSIHSIPHGASFLPHGALSSPNLPSLEELVLVRCNDMRRLPVETMLCHLRKLKQLSLVGCPELTLPSMEEALQSLPSLQKLVIIECAKLSLPVDPYHAHVVHGSDDKVEDVSASSLSAISTPPLRSLAMDDVELLGNQRFTGTYLAFLHELALWYSDLCSFPASMDCLRSLRSLTLIKCPNLREFPTDFRSLFPSLETLCIKDCPLLRCIPEMGMPASLEVLAIYTSPGPEEDDWAKVAHVRLIILERKIVQGTYSDYQDLLTKGKILLVPS